MHDARTASLVCRVGEALCALPLAHVGETMRPLPVEPLAGVPPFVRGLAIVRDRPTPVIDAASLLFDTASMPRRFVTVKTGAHTFILAVDEVLGVMALPGAVARALPTLVQSPRLAAVAGAGTLDGALLLVLEQARVVPDDVWTRLRPEPAS